MLYFIWLKILTDLNRKIHTNSRGTYGTPRVYQELLYQGVAIGYNRVTRLIRLTGMQGVSRRWPRRTPVWSHRQNQPAIWWTAIFRHRLQISSGWPIISYDIPSLNKFVYLAVVLDVLSRRIVGLMMAANIKSELVFTDQDMAFSQYKVNWVIQHSDKESQYTSLFFGNRSKKSEIHFNLNMAKRLRSKPWIIEPQINSTIIKPKIFTIGKYKITDSITNKSNMYFLPLSQLFEVF